MKLSNQAQQAQGRAKAPLFASPAGFKEKSVEFGNLEKGTWGVWAFNLIPCFVNQLSWASCILALDVHRSKSALSLCTN